MWFSDDGFVISGYHANIHAAGSELAEYPCRVPVRQVVLQVISREKKRHAARVGLLREAAKRTAIDLLNYCGTLVGLSRN